MDNDINKLKNFLKFIIQQINKTKMFNNNFFKINVITKTIFNQHQLK